MTSLNHGQYTEMSDITDNELERNDIKFIRLLGSGNFGEVYKAVISDCIVAVKSLKGKTILDFKISSIAFHISINDESKFALSKENASQKDKQDMLTELNVMKCLKSHNHVVQMIGYSTRSGKFISSVLD